MCFSWTFHELSFNSRSSKFASCISYTKRRERLCILFIWLFEVLLQNIQIKGQYLKADTIYFLNSFFFMTLLYYFTTITLLISPILIKNCFGENNEFKTECTQVVEMLWQRTLGDESEATKFRRPRRWMSSLRWEPSINLLWNSFLLMRSLIQFAKSINIS